MNNKLWTQTLKSINGIKILSVDKVSSCTKWNAHSSCVIQGFFENSNKKEMEKLLYKDSPIEIEIRKTDGETTYFFVGYILSIEIEEHIQGCKFLIELGDIGYEMDRIKRVRVFQDTSMSYKDVINKIITPYGFSYLSDEPLDQEIGQIIVQYNETDWEFLKRIVSHFQTVLFANYQNDNSFIQIGIIDTRTQEFYPDSYSVLNLLHETSVKIECGTKEVNIEDAICYKCKTREYYVLGQKVQFENTSLFIKECIGKYEGEEIIFEYILCKREALNAPKSYNSQIIGAALDATVQDVKNDVVKVHFNEENLTAVESSTWIPFSTVYSSPDGTGWYCMPEIGDSVRVFFPNEIENDCYAISSVHVSGGNLKKMRSNPDFKSISTKYGKQIELTPTDIKITNGTGMLICISDTDGITIISNEDITLNADENISIISTADTIDICAAKSIVLKQGQNSITIADDIKFEGTQLKVQ